MTLFLDVKAVNKLVNKVGNKAFIKGLYNYIKSDFINWTTFDKSARTAAHSVNGVIELMPVANDVLFGFKYVNGHPQNPNMGLSTVMAFGALSDVKTGYPKLFSELTLSTAFRTAVTSAMAAKALARKSANKMGVIGCGSQCEFQVIAFYILNGINEINLFDIDHTAIDKVINNLRLYPELKVIKCASAKECVSGVDIITTITADKTNATILTPDMIQAGMHINGVGGDCPGKTEIHPDVLKIGKIFVEHEPQTRVEGEIQQLSPDAEVHALWKVIAELEIGRNDEEQITIFDSVGFALEDLSMLRYLYDLAINFGIGSNIELIPILENPKDLFICAFENHAGNNP
jgi:ornithine cyclodeaminase